MEQYFRGDCAPSAGGRATKICPCRLMLGYEGGGTISKQQREVALHSRVRGKCPQVATRIYIYIYIYSRLGIIEKVLGLKSTGKRK